MNLYANARNGESTKGNAIGSVLNRKRADSSASTIGDGSETAQPSIRAESPTVIQNWAIDKTWLAAAMMN